MINIDLAGKTALVTGASQGLGEAIARRLHEAGASVVVNYYADPEGVNRRNAEKVAGDLGDRAMACEADVCNRKAVARLVERTVAHFGALDILVGCAGILRDHTVKNLTEAEWQAVVDTNLTGVFHACQAAAAVMRDKGRIVNISSISGFVGFYGQANYAATKAGVAAFGKVLGRELAKRQITVNSVAPGVILAGMGLTIPDGVRAEMLKNVPLGRFGDPREIADAVLFLCSDMASYVTGQTLHVNGGWY